MQNFHFSSMILEIIKVGKIVPSEVTVNLIQKAISSTDNHKFLIDGFPRTEENRLAYERIVSFNCSPYRLAASLCAIVDHFSPYDIF